MRSDIALQRSIPAAISIPALVNVQKIVEEPAFDIRVVPLTNVLQSQVESTTKKSKQLSYLPILENSHEDHDPQVRRKPSLVVEIKEILPANKVSHINPTTLKRSNSIGIVKIKVNAKHFDVRGPATPQYRSDRDFSDLSQAPADQTKLKNVSKIDEILIAGKKVDTEDAKSLICASVVSTEKLLKFKRQMQVKRFSAIKEVSPVSKDSQPEGSLERKGESEPGSMFLDQLFTPKTLPNSVNILENLGKRDLRGSPRSLRLDQKYLMNSTLGWTETNLVNLKDQIQDQQIDKNVLRNQFRNLKEGNEKGKGLLNFRLCSLNDPSKATSVYWNTEDSNQIREYKSKMEETGSLKSIAQMCQTQKHQQLDQSNQFRPNLFSMRSSNIRTEVSQNLKSVKPVPILKRSLFKLEAEQRTQILINQPQKTILSIGLDSRQPANNLEGSAKHVSIALNREEKKSIKVSENNSKHSIQEDKTAHVNKSIVLGDQSFVNSSPRRRLLKSSLVVRMVRSKSRSRSWIHSDLSEDQSTVNRK